MTADLSNKKIAQQSKSKIYFEGWYFRLTHSEKEQSVTFIPGISYSADHTANHAFIQVLNHQGISDYIKYPLSEFSYNKNPLTIKIGPNLFSLRYMQLLLGGKISVKGYIKFNNIIKPKFQMKNWGIMGPLKLVPHLPCYHDVISVQHDVQGSLLIDGELTNWNGGVGFIETDRGYSFPKAYTWLQCNTFQDRNIAFNGSVSLIEMGNMNFVGCYALLYTPTSHFNFASWQGASVRFLDYKNHQLGIVLRQGQYDLNIKVQLPEDYETTHQKIIAPVQGEMKNMISETMTAKIELVLWDKGKSILAANGEWCGAEIINVRQLIVNS